MPTVIIIDIESQRDTRDMESNLGAEQQAPSDIWRNYGQHFVVDSNMAEGTIWMGGFVTKFRSGLWRVWRTNLNYLAVKIIIMN